MSAPHKPIHRRPAKKWYWSRTIQLHAINAAQAVGVLIVNFLSTHPDGNVTKVELVALAVSAATIVLRVLTDTVIAGGPKA